MPMGGELQIRVDYKALTRFAKRKPQCQLDFSDITSLGLGSSLIRWYLPVSYGL